MERVSVASVAPQPGVPHGNAAGHGFTQRRRQGSLAKNVCTREVRSALFRAGVITDLEAQSSLACQRALSTKFPEPHILAVALVKVDFLDNVLQWLSPCHRQWKRYLELEMHAFVTCGFLTIVDIITLGPSCVSAAAGQCSLRSLTDLENLQICWC